MAGQSKQDPPGRDDPTVIVGSADAREAPPVDANSQAEPLAPGDVLRDRYTIESTLGEGGMGKVFLARDQEADSAASQVAIKVLSETFKQHPQSLKALRREANQSQRMNHPNIVNVFYFERTVEHVFMVMEYMEGASLEEYLGNNPQGASLASVWPIIEGCAEGLKYIHSQRIIHSDFKPSNVFLTRHGDVKVLDLGIARSLDEGNLVQGTTRFDPSGIGAMTPAYASCEMFQGLVPTEQDDLFALGCVVYELLTGVRPFPGMNAMEAQAAKVEPQRPAGLRGRQWRVLKSALAYGRADRPTDIAAFLEELSPQRRLGAVPWIAAAAALVAAAIAITYTVSQLGSDEERFLQATLVQFSPMGDSAPEDRVRDWLDQGGFFLDLGSRSLSEEEYDRGLSQLYLAPSSSYQSYRLVLERTYDETLRDLAAQGMWRIVTLLNAEVASLRENGKAAELVAKHACVSLMVHPRDTQMMELLTQLDDQIADGTNSVPECLLRAAD